MKDQLHEIFLKYLHSEIISEDEDMDELVHHVVAEYILALMQQGNIPDRWLDTLEEDLTEEVIDMYRKTTYGYMNLKDFRSAKKKKKIS